MLGKMREIFTLKRKINSIRLLFLILKSLVCLTGISLNHFSSSVHGYVGFNPCFSGRITSGSWIRLMICISEPHCGQVKGRLPDLLDKLPPGPGRCPRRLVIRYVQYGEILAVLFSGHPVPRSQHPLLAPPPFCSV
jgi:hypothetical protein